MLALLDHLQQTIYTYTCFWCFNRFSKQTPLLQATFAAFTLCSYRGSNVSVQLRATNSDDPLGPQLQLDINIGSKLFKKLIIVAATIAYLFLV
jgi:hypothetical protein